MMLTLCVMLGILGAIGYLIYLVIKKAQVKFTDALEFDALYCPLHPRTIALPLSHCPTCHCVCGTCQCLPKKNFPG